MTAFNNYYHIIAQENQIILHPTKIPGNIIKEKIVFNGDTQIITLKDKIKDTPVMEIGFDEITEIAATKTIHSSSNSSKSVSNSTYELFHIFLKKYDNSIIWIETYYERKDQLNLLDILYRFGKWKISDYAANEHSKKGERSKAAKNNNLNHIDKNKINLIEKHTEFGKNFDLKRNYRSPAVLILSFFILIFLSVSIVFLIKAQNEGTPGIFFIFPLGFVFFIICIWLYLVIVKDTIIAGSEKLIIQKSLFGIIFSKKHINRQDIKYVCVNRDYDGAFFMSIVLDQNAPNKGNKIFNFLIRNYNNLLPEKTISFWKQKLSHIVTYQDFLYIEKFIQENYSIKEV